MASGEYQAGQRILQERFEEYLTTREGRQALMVHVARSFVGVPFRHRGRDRFGVDCGGLILAVLRELGLTDWEPRGTKGYSDFEQLAVLEEGVKELFVLLTKKVKAENVQPGDVLRFNVGIRDRVPKHVGIATGEGSVIHVLQFEHNERGRRVFGHVVERQLPPDWEQECVGHYRFKGFCEEEGR